MLESLLRQFGLRYSPELLEAFLRHLVHIIFLLLAGLFALRLVNSALKRIWKIVPAADGPISHVEQRTETLGHILASVGKVVLWSVIIVMIIDQLGYDTKPLLTGAGILGLAVGFGAQSLVKDVIAGFFILLEDQYGVGDSVRIGDQDGVVEHMTLRTTILRNFEGYVHVIPNGSISSVTVMTRDWARAVVDTTVPHNVELGRLFAVLKGTGDRLFSEMKDQVLDKPEVLGIEKLSDDGTTVRMAVKTIPSKRADVTREWRRLILEALDQEGIQLSQKKGI